MDSQQKQPRKRVWAHKVRTGCKTCRLRRIKCDEEKPSCKRCRSGGHVCLGYLSQTALPSSDLATIVYPQPAVSLSPTQVDATDQELDVFHYFRTEILSHATQDIGWTLWALHFPQAAQFQPVIWYACNAITALHQKERTCLNSTQAHGNRGLDTLALTQHSIAISHILKIIRDTELSFHDKSTILAANILLLGCARQQGDVHGVIAHLKSGIQLIHQWRFWEQGAGTREQVSVFPPDPILIFYVQAESFWTDYDLMPFRTWQWEQALISLQSRPLSSLTGASLELEMIWNGLKHVFKKFPNLADSSETGFLLQRRRILQGYFTNWRTRYRKLCCKDHAAKDETTTILEIRQVLVDVWLRADINNLETCWDQFKPEFHKVVHLTEILSTLENAPEIGPYEVNFFSCCSTATVATSLQFLAKVCRYPALRRRAIAMLKTHQRRKKGAPSVDRAAFARGAEVIMEVEESAWWRTDRDVGCTCVQQEYICNKHRIIDFKITTSIGNAVYMMVRTVDDFFQNRPARRILITERLESRHLNNTVTSTIWQTRVLELGVRTLI